jgi:hypothetical protein
LCSVGAALAGSSVLGAALGETVGGCPVGAPDGRSLGAAVGDFDGRVVGDFYGRAVVGGVGAPVVGRAVVGGLGEPVVGRAVVVGVGQPVVGRAVEGGVGEPVVGRGVGLLVVGDAVGDSFVSRTRPLTPARSSRAVAGSTLHAKASAATTAAAKMSKRRQPGAPFFLS